MRAEVALYAVLVAAAPGIAGERSAPFEIDVGGTVTRAVEVIGVEAGAWRGRQFIAATPAIPEILEEQRVIVSANATATRVSAVHVQFFAARGARTGDVLRLYDDVRRRLIEQFGAPEWELREDGDGEEPLRTIQWRRDDGSIARAGIPRRLDGRGVVEVVMTARSLSRRDVFWGAEEWE